MKTEIPTRGSYIIRGFMGRHNESKRVSSSASAEFTYRPAEVAHATKRKLKKQQKEYSNRVIAL